jgi:hypothetical protein
LGLVVLGAFVAEVLGFVVLMGIRVLHGYGPFALDPLSSIGKRGFSARVVPGVHAGRMVGRARIARADRLERLLVGVAAVLIYEIAARGSGASIPISAAYLLAHTP